MERCGASMRACVATIFVAYAIVACWTLPSSADEPTSSGTGFLVNGNGDLVTNAHVVTDCTKLTVSGLGDATRKYVDIQNDLAVISTSQPPTGISALSIRRAPPRLGEDVAALGYPLSDILSDSIKITTGNVNSLVGIANDTRYLQISAPVQPGNSGGPLVDRAGHVIGISTATLGKKYAAESGILPQNVNFATRAGVLEVFLQARNVVYQTVETAEAPLDTPDLAEKVSKSVFQILCYQDRAPAAAVSAAPPASPPSQAYVQSPETKAASFVGRYHQAWSSDNSTALGFMQSAYGDNVSFYGKTISKTALLQEKIKFAERWPIRSYSVRPDSLAIQCQTTICHIEGIVDWSASSPARRKHSQGAASFSMYWDSSLETITSETGKVLSANR